MFISTLSIDHVILPMDKNIFISRMTQETSVGSAVDDLQKLSQINLVDELNWHKLSKINPICLSYSK